MVQWEGRRLSERLVESPSTENCERQKQQWQEFGEEEGKRW